MTHHSTTDSMALAKGFRPQCKNRPETYYLLVLEFCSTKDLRTGDLHIISTHFLLKRHVKVTMVCACTLCVTIDYACYVYNTIILCRWIQIDIWDRHDLFLHLSSMFSYKWMKSLTEECPLLIEQMVHQSTEGFWQDFYIVCVSLV